MWIYIFTTVDLAKIRPQNSRVSNSIKPSEPSEPEAVSSRLVFELLIGDGDGEKAEGEPVRRGG